MSDIIKRLRTAPVDNRPATLLNEAADEIEHLCAENKRLRNTLVDILWKAQNTIRPIPFQDEE